VCHCRLRCRQDTIIHDFVIDAYLSLRFESFHVSINTYWFRIPCEIWSGKCDTLIFPRLLQIITPWHFLYIMNILQNYTNEQIMSRINTVNACYHTVLNILFSWLLSKSLKIKIQSCLYGFLTQHHAMKAYWGSGSLVPCILWPRH
jgi:hypothetical protein